METSSRQGSCGYWTSESEITGEVEDGETSSFLPMTGGRWEGSCGMKLLQSADKTSVNKVKKEVISSQGKTQALEKTECLMMGARGDESAVPPPFPSQPNTSPQATCSPSTYSTQRIL